VAIGDISWSYEMDVHPEQLWEPGHEIYDHCKHMTEQLERSIKINAPPNRSTARWPRTGTGRLQAGIVGIGKRTGAQSFDITIVSQAPYTMYVHGGTAFQRGGHIYSTMGYANRAFIDANIGTWHEGEISPVTGVATGEGRFGILPIPGGMFMALPPGGGFTRRFHLRVRGQRAHPFLIEGWNSVAIRHPEEFGAPFDPAVGYGESVRRP
jgi:hypothetical protein